MEDQVKDAITKGLIEVVRKPRSEKLAELIRATRTYTADFWFWQDWEKVNRN